MALLDISNSTDRLAGFVGSINAKGHRDGHGTQTFPDGALFEGMWRDNKPEGFGEFRRVGGHGCLVYHGEWAGGRRHGEWPPHGAGQCELVGARTR